MPGKASKSKKKGRSSSSSKRNSGAKGGSRGSGPKSSRGRKSASDHGGEGPRYLLEKHGELEKEILAFMAGARSDHDELTAKQSALDVLGSYVSERRTSYQRADSKVLGPENFRDKNTSYVPMAKGIAKAYRDLSKATDSLKEAKEEAKKYRGESAEAQRKYKSAEKARSAAEKRVKALEKEVEDAKKNNVEELEKAKAEYDRLKFSVDRIASLKGRNYDKLDAASREGPDSDAYKWVIDFTLYPSEQGKGKKAEAPKERTFATKWVEQEAMRDMGHCNRLIEMLNSTSVDLGYKPKPTNPAN